MGPKGHWEHCHVMSMAFHFVSHGQSKIASSTYLRRLPGLVRYDIGKETSPSKIEGPRVGAE